MVLEEKDKIALKKTKRDIGNVLVLGTGLTVGTAVESKLAPPVPVFTQFAPIAATAGPIIGAGIAIRSLKQLENIPKKKKRFL